MILFVDDEEIISEMTVSSLRSRGLEVSAFNSPKKGLAFFEDNYEQIDLAIIDNRMPELTGATLARKMKELSADLCIILTTGYEDDDVSTILQEHRCIHLLKKPFRFKELKDLMKELGHFDD